MKTFKLLALIALFGTFATTKSNAQIDVTLNPIGLLFGDLSAGADFVLGDNFSIEGAIGYGSGDIGGQDWTNIPIKAVAKYYLNPDDGADKFYVDAFARFVSRNFDATDVNGEATWNRFGLGFGLGYKVVGNSGFVFDIGFGVGRTIADKITYKTAGDEYDIDWGNVIFNGKLGVGYRFGR